MAIKITDEEIDRERVKWVFGLTGGELADSPWKSGDELVSTYWYEGVPDYAHDDFRGEDDWRDGEFRTAVFDALYGGEDKEIVESDGAKWVLVNSYRTSGEVECCNRDGSPESEKVTRDQCRLVLDPYCHSDTDFGRPGSGRYGQGKAKRAECPFCEARLGEDHGFIYIGDGWVEAVYKFVPAPRDLFAAYIGDGALYGAAEVTDDGAGSATSGYWSQLRLEREPFEIFKLAKVPAEIADKLIAQGTSDQEFSDSYEAADAAAPYVVKGAVSAYSPAVEDESEE